jgi:hypothetical protein
MKFGVVLLTLFLVFFAKTSDVYAGTMDVSAFPLMWGNCTSSVAMQHTFTATGTTVDVTSPNRDAFALVLYDGHGDAFAYIGISVGIGTWIAPAWGWNYPILVQPKSRPFTLKIFDNTTPIGTGLGDLAGAQHGTIVDTLYYDPAAYGVCSSLPVYVPSSDTEIHPPFSDGRINNWDTGNPVVLFGHDYETGRGLVVYSPEGAVVLEASPEQIAAITECPAENTLIVSAGDVALYRLASCHYQLNAPSLDGTKTYVLIFNDLYENTGYSSHEE